MPLRVDAGTPIEPPPGGLPRDRILQVPYESQAPFLNLCWAACCQMVEAYMNLGTPTLSQVASTVLRTDCSEVASCDVGAWPCDAYPRLGLSCQTARAAFSPQSVSDWISGLYPIQPYLQWKDGNSHTILVVGLYANGDLQVNDPDPSRGAGRYSYEHVLDAFGMGSWQMTWYGMEVTANAQVA